MTVVSPRNGAGLPYESGEILSDSQAHARKLAEAWRHIKTRKAAGEALHNASGLHRGLPIPADTDPWVFDDEWAGALYADEVRELGLRHLGGDPGRHDIAVMNRLTAALFAALQITVRPGSTVIGVSASHSHPAVVRGVRDAGGLLIDTTGIEQFRAALDNHADVSVVALTRLAVTYDALDESDIRAIVEAAHAAGALVIIDDAGGARVGPAMLGQPRTLELGADLGATGLDKYGVSGPRVGLLGGRSDLVSRAQARAFELGSECRPVLYPAVAETLREYRPGQVRELVAATERVGSALAARLPEGMVRFTPFITRLPGMAIRDELSHRSGVKLDLVPIEASAAVAMCLLRDHGLLTVHFAGLPPGTESMLVKFMSADLVARLGGPGAFAAAVDDALDKAAAVAPDQGSLRALLLGVKDSL